MSNKSSASNSIDRLSVAIIGMAGRFPGAGNIEEFWRNLCGGVESISFFTEEELKAAGESSADIKDPRYVGARGVLEGVELFDASFFGFYPREVQMMDPQHRLFLECAWEALEDAGCSTDSYEGVVGVFGGAGINSYLLSVLSPNLENLKAAEGYQLAIGNHNDFLTTRVSYKLNLRGPSLNIQSACSTSLVAVHVACRSLLGRQCDVALAGGVTIGLPQKRGYLFQEGMILSPDGHCRSFDAKARGTVAGNGVGIVVLKRLVDAVADGDHIYAVIKGSAVNNDGSLRIGFTAPGVTGQAEVIAAAHEIAGIDTETLSYIEAHGTGTPLGDPIEIAALTQVFREKTEASGFCAIGSVKTNVGHLDAAAGVAGLIKTALALDRGVIPPSLNFERPNPEIDFSGGPFYVNTKLAEWKSGEAPRRAGVSSFGIGGANAHVVLEEAPAVESATKSRSWQLLVLSAKTDTALEAATSRLAARLKGRSALNLPELNLAKLDLPELNLADVAYTLQVGRKAFAHRRILICQTLESACGALEKRDPKRVFSASVTSETDHRPVVFMFSGQGAQYVNMGFDLYQAEPTFREAIDYCSELLKPHLDLDLRNLLYPASERLEEAARRLGQTRFTQPALFAIEYALARLWMEWGIRPQAMIGHSVGEYVAACLAGVFSPEDALRLVAARGRLMQEAPEGAMLSVKLEEPAARDLLGVKISLAAVNGPASCVVSGPRGEIIELEQRLTAGGIGHRRLHTSHAFHSQMMDSILKSFEREVEKVALKSPRIPYVSNLTGTWITEAEATDPGYYVKHLRHAVRFADGIGELLKEPGRVLLEVGPGQTLSALARENSDAARGHVILNSTRHPHDQQSDVSFILNALGKLWLAGAKIDWPGFYARERRRRVSLPAYPFERQRYWLDEKESAIAGDVSQSGFRELANWFYVPSWKRADSPRALAANVAVNEKLNCPSWLMLSDDHGLGSGVAERLADLGQDVIAVRMGARFERIGERAYTVDPQSPADYEALLAELSELKKIPQKIVHFWNVTPNDLVRSGPEFFEGAQATGFYSLLFLAQALGRRNVNDQTQLWVVSTNLQEVTGEELLCPEKATLLGPCQVIPQEYPNIICRSLDVIISDSRSPDSQIMEGLIDETLIDRLVTEFTANSCDDRAIAYRGNHRWALSYEQARLDGLSQRLTRLRQGGVYLITGGLGKIGLTLAEHLARAAQARLILIGRAAFPSRDEWDQWLTDHDERDQTSRKIRRLMEIEAAGAEVLVLSADVANERRMHEALALAEDRFGPVHGVIHAAGEVGEKAIRTVQELKPDECASQFQAKVHGLNALAGALKGRELDFFILQSSLSSVLGGLGFAAYSAANHYLDAFARKRGQSNWISMNWDAWRFDEERGFDAATTESDISPEDGVEVFKRLLSVEGFNQVIISTADLQARIGKWIKAGSNAEPKAEARSTSSASASRPQLQITYVAPGDDLERRIVAVWQNLLGIEPVGIHDNFFDLGGDSLLGTQMIAQLRAAFQTEFPMRGLFEDPTVAGAAKIIDAAMRDGRSQVDKLTEALKKVEGLTEEEAGALLARFQAIGK